MPSLRFPGEIRRNSSGRRIYCELRLAFSEFAPYLSSSAISRIHRRVYLGHYSTVDSYVIELIDAYGLDVKLDEAIAEPFRRHVDIDVSALGRSLVSNVVIYSLLAVPVGVWVFHEETE